ncbi:methyltransferase domain-containing protein [Streptomyces europaeiscabiei]|uniref:class I SAM-dependent methyltransferase n=1 Tax=Streptomyces europaeiscabiei TaxID=146819 RepID=UPI0029A14977|nr:class I SAM-dependent methyltransferase [Streptomyces europaeiscabiei]MDX3632311.1 class I SAM-dependent methyltransferase [Streptomyces europaeiscabiei]MDX3646594.1 class I SAM-dependent methyltransferase [Streptomyces europaeiscabiei]WUD36637.1 methyltransferase domain-containing protein [Streptomyces europaeiscabiei]
MTTSADMTASAGGPLSVGATAAAGAAVSGAALSMAGRGGDTPAPEGHQYAPQWLELRESADADARAADLLDPLRIRLANLPGRATGLTVHDLGCGTGSMGRWLAPRLDGAQRWVLHDQDPNLLRLAVARAPRAAADGSPVTVTTRRGDIGRLTAADLDGASLVTASALLDVLTREEIEALAAACAGAGVPALLTLSVVGRVDVVPAHPMDTEIAEAFNAHQRASDLLGPDAITTACEAFAQQGATVRVHPSPWQLDRRHTALTEEWLRGWVGAACEQRPELTERADAYLRDRLRDNAAGELRVVVHHSDLLALPRPTGGVS